jgi:hypothetical protein
MNIETVEELCEHIADKVGVYGEDRISFVKQIEDRMRDAIKNENILCAIGETKKDQENERIYAKNVTRGVKYELTHLPIFFHCPHCKTENNTHLTLEEDLCLMQDNTVGCRSCHRPIIIKASEIFDV